MSAAAAAAVGAHCRAGGACRRLTATAARRGFRRPTAYRLPRLDEVRLEKTKQYSCKRDTVSRCCNRMEQVKQLQKSSFTCGAW